jgi:hypothetical protein
MPALLQRLFHVLRVTQGATSDMADTLCALAAIHNTSQLTVTSVNLNTLLTHLQAQLPSCSMLDISSSVAACGRMQYAPLQLLAALEQQPVLLKGLLDAAVPTELATLAAACCQLGYSSNVLPGVLLQQAIQVHLDSTASSCSMRDVCDLCWCAAALDLRQCVPQVLQLVGMCDAQMWGEAEDKQVCSVYRVHLWLLDSQLPAPGWGLRGELSQQQLQQCKDSWEQQLKQSAAARSHGMHKSVLAAFRTLPAGIWQYPPEPGQRTADGAHNIYIAATTALGVRVAVAVVGGKHFVRPRVSFDGLNLFQNRALAAWGFDLVIIPVWVWKRLRSAQQQWQYLLGELQQWLPLPAPPVHVKSEPVYAYG